MKTPVYYYNGLKCLVDEQKRAFKKEEMMLDVRIYNHS